MALKILSTIEKNKLSIDELIKYEEKLRVEVARREARFSKSDTYFKEQSRKYQETLNERNDEERFPRRRAGARDDIKIGIRVLEKTLKSSQSTLKGRKEMLDNAFRSFNANLQENGAKPISRRKYNKIAKFFDALDDYEDVSSYFYDSNNVIMVVNEGLNFDDFINTVLTLDKINEEKKYGLRHYSLDMIIEAYNEKEEKEIEKIFEKYTRNTSESNEW